MKQSRTKQLLMLAAVMAVAAVVAYAFLFISIRDKIKAASLLLNEADAIEQKEKKLGSVEILVKGIEAERRQIHSYIVEKDDSIDFIEMIEELGERAGAPVEVTSIGIEPLLEDSGESDTGELLRLNFTSSGSWSSLFYLLSLVESVPFNVLIEQANLENAVNPENMKSSKTWEGKFSVVAVKHK
jgi:hypothetical protein